jgi:excisionase family DNA binding protein
MPEEFAPGDYETPTEAARRFGVQPDTVRWWVRTHQLGAIRIGQRLYIRRDAQRPNVEHIEPAS